MKKLQKQFFAVLMMVLVFALSGCGANHGSPEAVVKSLIKAYGESDKDAIKDCYGLGKKDENADLQAEIDMMLKYISVHNTSKVKVVDCGILSENDLYAYVYVTFNLIQEDKQEYPCVDTYVIRKTDKKYYVVSTANITEEMKNQAITDYQEFMNKDAYKEYRRAYDTFIKKNPGYEDKIASKMN